MRLSLIAGRVPQSYVDQLDQIGLKVAKLRFGVILRLD
jgi:hypothetical protein